ncbi:MAG: ABC transporter permease subunit [Clostridia bacterium]|nr:ABC transporter permease subunit [Clostridia bacterium]
MRNPAVSDGSLRERLRPYARNVDLYLFVVPALVYLFLYCYLPMYGIQIAFKDFRIGMGIWDSPWVGLKHFEKFLGNSTSRQLIWNTLRLSLMTLVFGFPLPIVFALLLNEVRYPRFKKVVQTVSYAPHFISTVVLVSMLSLFLDSNNGIVNKLIGLFGIGPYNFMSSSAWFPNIYVISDIWQNLGWNAVIYISALAGVDIELHEAAKIDGANRLQRICHVDIPSIFPTIAIMLILQTGNLMTVGFEKAYLMQNALNTGTSEIISTYVYKMGLLYNQYSYSTAINLFNSVVNCILLVTVNGIVRRLSDSGLW